METSKDISTQKGKYINTDSGSIKLFYAAALFGEPDRITTTNSGKAAGDQTFLQSNAKQRSRRQGWLKKYNATGKHIARPIICEKNSLYSKTGSSKAGNRSNQSSPLLYGI